MKKTGFLPIIILLLIMGVRSLIAPNSMWSRRHRGIVIHRRVEISAVLANPEKYYGDYSYRRTINPIKVNGTIASLTTYSPAFRTYYLVDVGGSSIQVLTQRGDNYVEGDKRTVYGVVKPGTYGPYIDEESVVSMYSRYFTYGLYSIITLFIAYYILRWIISRLQSKD